jgi:8-oxo-dGTP pyrophosphatase MutT (NUDIX family)
VPGGAVDEGELPEAGAIRELAEEAGLVPTSAMTLIGLYELPTMGAPALMVSYACRVADGEPVLSHEHTDMRWVEPEQLRDGLAGSDGFLGDIHADVERFIAWRANR